MCGAGRIRASQGTVRITLRGAGTQWARQGVGWREGGSSQERGAKAALRGQDWGGGAADGVTVPFAIPVGSPPSFPPSPGPWGPPIHCPWPSRAPDALRTVRGILPGAAGGAPDGAPEVSRGLDSVEASPRPLPGRGRRLPGTRGTGTLARPRNQRGGGRSPGKVGGDHKAGASSRRVEPRPDRPRAGLLTSLQRAHRKPRSTAFLPTPSGWLRQ